MITANELRKIMKYDPESGVFVWLTMLSNKGPIGKEVGAIDRYGYIVTSIHRKQYKVHRLSWLYVTGEWPVGSIDHINGVRDDNRWINLRDVTHIDNCQNKVRPRRGNLTGFMGVTRRRDLVEKPYKAQITVNYKLHVIGYFSTAEEANEKYLEARRIMQTGNTL